MINKMEKWLLFGVFISVLPILCAFVVLRVKSQAATLLSVIRNGELLVIGWVMCAAALGELIGTKNQQVFFQILGGGSAFIVLILSATVFAAIGAWRLDNQALDDKFILIISLWLFAAGVLSSASCIFLSEA